MAVTGIMRAPAALAPVPSPERVPTWPWMAGAVGLLLLGLVGWSLDARLGVAAAGLLVAPLLVAAPRWGLLLVVAVIPFDAVAGLFESRAFTLTKLLAMAVLAGWLVHVLLRRGPIRLSRPGWLLAAYVGFAALSVAWAADTDQALDGLRTLAQLGVFYVMVRNLLDSPADVQRVLDVLLVATVVLALVVLWQLPAERASARAELIYGAQEFNPNYLAATLVFPAVAAVGAARRRGLFSWWRLAALLPIAVALVATESRGGTGALVAGLVALAAMRPGLGPRVAVAVLVSGLLLPLALPEQMVDRLLERWGAASEDRLSGRIDIWRVGIAMIEDQPIAGTGYGGFREAFYRYMLEVPVDPHFGLAHSRGNRVAHNVYLGTVAELGLVGGALLFAALLAHGLAAWRAARTAPEALVLPAIFVTMLVFGNSIDLMTQKLPWLLLGCMSAAAWTARAEAVAA